MKMETIQFAAIFRSDKEIVTGRDHGECIKKSPYGTCKKGSIMGFLTNDGRFVTRSEAAKIAFNAGQVDTLGKVLFSEELWSRENGGKFNYDPEEGYVPIRKG